jgi:hypothetical protein
VSCKLQQLIQTNNYNFRAFHKFRWRSPLRLRPSEQGPWVAGAKGSASRRGVGVLQPRVTTKCHRVLRGPDPWRAWTRPRAWLSPPTPTDRPLQQVWKINPINFFVVLFIYKDAIVSIFVADAVGLNKLECLPVAIFSASLALALASNVRLGWKNSRGKHSNVSRPAVSDKEKSVLQHSCLYYKTLRIRNVQIT